MYNRSGYFRSGVLCALLQGLVACDFSAQAQISVPTEIPIVRPQQVQSETPPAREENSGIVMVDNLKVRSQPGPDAETVYVAGNGERMTLVREQGDWICVEAGNGIRGWAPSDSISKGSPEEPGAPPTEPEPEGSKRNATSKANHGGIKSGTWTGFWEKSNGSRAKFTFCITVRDTGKIQAVGTVAGWTCWEVFTGEQGAERVSLCGVGVVKNSRPEDQYELDLLELYISSSGLNLSGRWSDKSGSSGKLDLKFVASEIGEDPEIQEILKL